MRKVAAFKTKGMQRDLSVSAFNSEYSYENKNIRIMSTDESTLLSLINERGNKLLDIPGIGNSIKGTPIGQTVLDNELVLFTTDNTIDRIYKIVLDNDDDFSGSLLYEGSLGFDYKHPIEAISIYENSEIKKIYWTDGKNQPRVINIADSSRANWANKSFDFVPKLALQEEISIVKSSSSNGYFAPGTIQYSFTYFNKYGQETNIFYTSPLYYVSYDSRGGSPEDKISNSFSITLKNLDNSFDYVRIYSIQRTSIDATPIARKVVDLAVPTSGEIGYTDNGSSGESKDPVELLYIGGEEAVFGTLTQKDNTLFLGDIQVKRKVLSDAIRKGLYEKPITFTDTIKSIVPPDPTGYYPYINQLSLNSFQFKTFKYLEYYRFGIQAQHCTGKWSEPIWINDVQNTVHIDTIFYNNSAIKLPVAEFTLDDSKIIEELTNQDYIKVRPVIVYPELNDREVICQGILCPTVYNVSDRYSNSPFAQSSWFVRPNAPFDEYKAFNYYGEGQGDWGVLGLLDGQKSLYSRAGIISNNYSKIYGSNEGASYNSITIDPINRGSWSEFRNNYPIPSNNKRNSEIQCIWNPPLNPYIEDSLTDSGVSEWVSINSENYYVDQSIVTLHSPDIEFDDGIKNMDTSSLKLRIVGMVPLTSFASDIDIQTSTPVNSFYKSSDLPMGFYKEPIGVENDFSKVSDTKHYVGNSCFGWRGLNSGVFWFDELNSYKDGQNNNNKFTTGFVVYPWHRDGSLNNTKFAKDGYKSAMLEKKRLSNIRYSYKSVYFNTDNIWNAYIEGDSLHTGISGVAVFNSNEVSLLRLPGQKNSGLSDINYYGNVDKLLAVSRIGSKSDGYPIITTGRTDTETNAHILFTRDYTQVSSTFTDQITGIDPVRIKYKSTPHAVLALNYTTEHAQRILPTIRDTDDGSVAGEFWVVNDQNVIAPEGTHMYWDKSRTLKQVSQDVITNTPEGPISMINASLQHGWLWLGELYNDNVVNRFGGKTEEAFENNQWLPCGEAVDLKDINGNNKSTVTIRWTEGDTYYQRYDHIKTYPFTLEDQNQVTDIVSFMCETRVNIDGRYDRNRGQTTNFAITPANFNLLNEVYSQKNNFFNYRTVNPNKLNLDKFNNTITWTKTKTAGELVDTWTNITLASTLDLDGDKGNVRALRRFNNNILAFQDTGISQILYNENMQIASTEGVPIEIANSGKVTGKRYLTNTVGCVNKWSICETPNGLYFIDDITKGIFLFNGQLNNLSDKLGFHSWINKVSDNTKLWDPVNFNNFVTYYDKVNGDVFFINKDQCLAFSEPLGQFSSFYSYEHTPYFANIKDIGISFNTEFNTGHNNGIYRPWLHNKGDYNMYFNKYQPFYTTVIANPDMQVDKIFNNLEFRADNWDKNGTLLNSTFDTLNTWNEYQKGEAKLINTIGKPSTLKKKFRIWRANIPRDKSNGRDRMRNPWLYLKLSMESENTNKTILHDMVVHYFE